MSNAIASNRGTTVPKGLEVISAYESVTGRYFNLSNGVTVKLSHVSGVFVCLRRLCIANRDCWACDHVTVAAVYHGRHPMGQDVATAPHVAGHVDR